MGRNRLEELKKVFPRRQYKCRVPTSHMKRKMEMSIRGNPEGSQLILMWQTVLDLIAVYFLFRASKFFFSTGIESYSY
jgi:hypothetical protein